MKPYTQTIKTIILALILSFGISFVYAWVGPTATPPNGNASAPINTSVSTQYKGGALGVGGLIRGYANAIFDGNVGIGTTAPGAIIEVKAPTTGAFNTIFRGRSNDGTKTIDLNLQNDGTANFGSNFTNLGIGTTGPIEKLSVLGNIFLNNTADAGVRIQNGGGNSFWINSPTASLMAIGGVGGTIPTSGAINIDNRGNVGINKDVPTARLEIGGVPGTDGIKFPDGTLQTSAGSRFVTGTYFGSGVDNREIVVGFQPDDVEVGTIDTYEPMHRNKYMPANTSQAVASGGFYTDAIKNFTPNGFTIGIRDTVNLVGRTYWYNAIKGGTPPVVGAVPVINSISISPSPIATGQSTTISWSSANVASCVASGPWSGAKSASGSQLITPPGVGGNGQQANYTYTLTCYNSDGSLSDTKSAIVNVKGWNTTTGNGNFGESCDSWLSRTGQAGVNNSAPASWLFNNFGPFPVGEGNCLYIAGGTNNGDYKSAASSYADPTGYWQPASWHCCGNNGNEANTSTRR